MKGIIYKYTSPSGKSYIGQTVRPEDRMNKHRRMENDCAFHRAIKKYGFDNFTYEVLVTVDLDDEQELKQKLDFFERFYIRKYHSYENGYNLTLGGGGTLGFKVSEEVRHKISEARKGKVLSEEHKAKLSEVQKGKKLSEEHKNHLSEAHKGKTLSEETKRKMSELRKNQSEETRRKISESLKGRKKGAMSEEHKQKIREAWAKKKQQKSA